MTAQRTAAHALLDAGRVTGCVTQADVFWGDGERTHALHRVHNVTTGVPRTMACVTLAAVSRDGGAIRAAHDVRTVRMDVCRTLENATVGGVTQVFGEATARQHVLVTVICVGRVTVCVIRVVRRAPGFGVTSVEICVLIV
jgi:hypothetical protein